jgi:hypothetical protein
VVIFFAAPFSRAALRSSRDCFGFRRLGGPERFDLAVERGGSKDFVAALDSGVTMVEMPVLGVVVEPYFSTSGCNRGTFTVSLEVGKTSA